MRAGNLSVFRGGDSRPARRVYLAHEGVENGVKEAPADSPPLRVVTNGAHTTMDGYQWAMAAAAHDERHVRQILELKASPDYPA
jgi:hypothetical protein